jgi:hypothetical protein
MFTNQVPEKRRVWPYILISVVAILGIAIWSSYKMISSLLPEKILQSKFVQDQVRKELGDDKAEVFNMLPEILGFNAPKTYLLLFLNNTELRPGGGFIGVYAVVHVDKGQTKILTMEGTEAIDRNAPKDVKPVAPKPISDNLKVDRWYFRDSNWSPDFAQSSRDALTLFKAENGTSSNHIDAVIGVTATVLEELMKQTGPFTIDGIQFTADNVIEKLEYEVEYGYSDRGLVFQQRKNIIQPFLNALMEHVKNTGFSQMDAYIALAGKLVKEKQVMAYSVDGSQEKLIEKYNADGEVNMTTSSDYLMWVDANLAALKTDYAMKRNLTYSLVSDKDGKMTATARMEYTNTGKFDWRTTRYRTYTRVYVPEGSELVSTDGAMKTDRSSAPGVVDKGVEFEKQWFGTFIAVEPGQTKSLSFTYTLPQSISDQIKNGLYTLFVQKELGTLNNGLTLSLDFGKTIVSANPGESPDKWNDSKYEVHTDLSVDRDFNVTLSPDHLTTQPQ